MHSRSKLLTMVKRKRLELGFTQEELADILNIGRTTYINFERGHSRLYNSNLVKFADYLGKTVEEFICGDTHFLSEVLNDNPLYSKIECLSEDYERRLAENREEINKLLIQLQEKDKELKQKDEQIGFFTRHCDYLLNQLGKYQKIEQENE